MFKLNYAVYLFGDLFISNNQYSRVKVIVGNSIFFLQGKNEKY